MVSWVPGSPMDWAATMPTASPASTRRSTIDSVVSSLTLAMVSPLTTTSSAMVRPVPVLSIVGSLWRLASASRAAVFLADDDVLGHVDQTPGEVPGVGGPQRGVGQALAGAVGGDEVLHHRQPFPEAGLDRPRDGLTLGVGDQTTHTGDLPDLHHVASGTGVD